MIQAAAFLCGKSLVDILNRLGAGLSVLTLLSYHWRRFMLHLRPYLKTLSNFENRSFYAPPSVRVMETWAAAMGGAGKAS